MKIPFDIKFRPQIESGEYRVETEAGLPAKVMDWEYNDRFCGKCIAIKIIKGDGDHGLLYTHEGKRASIFPTEEGSDLFLITPEPELTEFEQALETFLMNADASEQTFHENVKKYADKLLELAKEELQEKVIHDYWKQAADRCVQAREEGKAEALKDLPMWRKWESGACGNSDGHPIALVSGAGGIRFVSVLGATGEKYIMLDDLKKLPGFND